MLDIIILVLVGLHIAKIARRKNRSPVGYVLLLVFSYFGLGIFLGIVSIVVADVDPDGPDNEFILAAIPGLLIGYALAVGLSYIVVCAVPPVPKRRRRYRDAEYDDYDDDNHDRPVRRPLRDEDPYDYDDDRPRRRRDEDDDFDRPRRGRRDDY